MPILLYNLLLILLSPLIFLYLLVRLSQGKEDITHWGERFGRYTDPPQDGTPRFWVHAVSVGEVMAAVPILRELRERFPDAYILLSTTTRGGREVARKQMPPANSVVYFPLDFPFAVHNAVRTIRPDALILMEWEIWPGLIHSAKKFGAKIVVLNGRISDRGLKRNQKGGNFLTRPALQQIDLFAMQSEEDTRRAVSVGTNPTRTQTFGNTKFDESVTPLTPEERTALRTDLGISTDAPVWICGSTRDDADPNAPDEETRIAEALKTVRARFPNLVLIVAPRHLERADKAAEAFTRAGFTVVRRSQGEKPTDVLLLDTFGELGRTYAIANIAFVGGSLVKRGGQSVFQPLAQGVPTLFGPNMQNQRDISTLAKTAGVGFEVTNAQELAQEVIRLLSSEDPTHLCHKARALIQQNQGVSVHSIDAIANLLSERKN